jgi:cytoplasmic iron level regulating protein YaaA (DUF328/UPF0246 family)
VIVLLAPSEGKTLPGGPPVDLAQLAYPALTAQRVDLVERLQRLAGGPRPRALRALGLGPGQARELERDRDLLGAPAGPAGEVYTGVLYQHLDLASLPAGATRRAAERLYVASALWGVVSIADRIPAYRLSIGASLPRRRALAAWWRPALAAALPADAFVVDLRSAAYAAAWRPAAGTVVEVRALRQTGTGRTPISHMVKAVRGDVARCLVLRQAVARTPDEVAGAVEASGERVELAPPERAGGAWRLDVSRS